VDKTIKQLIADILDMDANSINESTSADKIDSWDSTNHLNICFAVEQELGIRLEVLEMESMTSFANIMKVVHAKQNS
jgi:acyl carrier protein